MPARQRHQHKDIRQHQKPARLRVIVCGRDQRAEKRTSGIFDLTASNLAGWGIIAISALLTLLNVCDGLRKLAKLRYHTALQIVLFLAYVLVAGRIVEVVWNFRA